MTSTRLFFYALSFQSPSITHFHSSSHSNLSHTTLLQCHPYRMVSTTPPLSPSIPTAYPLPCSYPVDSSPLSPKPLHLGLGPPPRIPIRPSISPLGDVRRTQSDTRGPPLGDPSLGYMVPGSDFIRLRSAHKRSASSRCVVTLNSVDMGRKRIAEREGIGEEDEERDWKGIELKGKNCSLTNGVLPLIQTDRLALESIGKLLAHPSGVKLITSPHLHQIKIHQSVCQLSIP